MILRKEYKDSNNEHISFIGNSYKSLKMPTVCVPEYLVLTFHKITFIGLDVFPRRIQRKPVKDCPYQDGHFGDVFVNDHGFCGFGSETEVGSDHPDLAGGLVLDLDLYLVIGATHLEVST